MGEVPIGIHRQELFRPRLTEDQLKQQRKKVLRECFHGDRGRMSPEWLLREATQTPIGFLDLFSYHEQRLHEHGENYLQEVPDKPFVSVGIEFPFGGGRWENKSGTRLLINYDAPSFVERLSDRSVDVVNIDYPFQRTELSLKSCYRVLQPGGKLYIWNDNGDDWQAKNLHKEALESGFMIRPMTDAECKNRAFIYETAYDNDQHIEKTGFPRFSPFVLTKVEDERFYE